MSINEKFFFDYARVQLFGGTLSTDRVNAINVILKEWFPKYKSEDDRWLAYALGTVHHETDRTMKPIREYGGNKYFFDMYDKDGKRPDVAKRLGNTKAGDGVKFHGRGYVQLTGRTNYEKWTNAFNGSPDLASNPDKAMDVDVAIKILFVGMKAGSFTGKKFSDYFYGTTSDWKNARRIINGMDKAELVAGYAQAYYAAISYTV